jgi:hypothetical protein
MGMGSCCTIFRIWFSFLFCLFVLLGKRSRPASWLAQMKCCWDVEFCDYRWGKCIKITTSDYALYCGDLFNIGESDKMVDQWKRKRAEAL